MSAQGAMAVEPVEDSGRAGLLLHPLRQRILAEAHQASTAAEIARRLGMPPQKVNYHVRTLVEAGFLEPAGEGRRRNLVEKRYRASARSYLLLPQVLGRVGPGTLSEADRFSATYLMHLSALLQQELATWLDPDRNDGEGVPTLSLEAEIRFESPGQRATFAEALREAVTDVIAGHTTPAFDPDGAPRPGRNYRIVVGCYPVPDGDEPSTAEARGE